MSHAEYIKDLDESQLLRLIEMAYERIEEIKTTGWIELWVVSSDSYVNLKWFPGTPDGYRSAIDWLRDYSNKNPETELDITKERYRPAQAADCLED